MIREPLTRQEVIDAIERKGGSKIPVLLHKWWGTGLEDALGPALNEMADNYPDDIFTAWYLEPGYEESPNANKSYRLGYKDDYSSSERHSIGNAITLLPDWAELDQFLADFPDPNEPGIFDDVERLLPEAQGRYKLGCFWRLFHERLWTIRGMENLMMDYYDNMEELKIIGKKIVDFYKVIVDKYHALGFDGIFSSDDLGHQTGPMMSPDIFEELYLPLYKELIAHVHSKGMHMFLHSCGDNTKLMEFLIEAGLDVFHPVQKGCMDATETVKKYGNRITFLYGVDVQQLLPNGTVDEVRSEIREMIRTFRTGGNGGNGGNGGLLLAMGNGIMPGTPFDNIEAAFQEMTLPADI